MHRRLRHFPDLYHGSMHTWLSFYFGLIDLMIVHLVILVLFVATIGDA